MPKSELKPFVSMGQLYNTLKP